MKLKLKLLLLLSLAFSRESEERVLRFILKKLK